MLQYSRNKSLFGSWKAPSWEPTATAPFLPIADTDFNHCRPIRAFVMHIPLQIMATDATQLAHISARVDDADAPPRFLAIGALAGLLTKNHATLDDTFSDTQRNDYGTQFRTRLCLEWEASPQLL